MGTYRRKGENNLIDDALSKSDSRVRRSLVKLFFKNCFANVTKIQMSQVIILYEPLVPVRRFTYCNYCICVVNAKFSQSNNIKHVLKTSCDLRTQFHNIKKIRTQGFVIYNYVCSV